MFITSLIFTSEHFGFKFVILFVLQLLLQKEREDVTSSHKVSQIRNESNVSVKVDQTVDASNGPNFVSNKVSPLPLTAQPLNTSRSSVTELQSFYGKHEYEKAITRPSSVTTGIFPGMHPVQEAPVGVVAPGHFSTVQMNGSLFQTTKNTANRQEYLRAEMTAMSNGHLAISAGHSGARYYAEKQMLVHQPPPLTWMSNMGKYLPFSSSQSTVEAASANRLHGSVFEDSMARYAGKCSSQENSSEILSRFMKCVLWLISDCVFSFEKLYYYSTVLHLTRDNEETKVILARDV